MVRVVIDANVLVSALIRPDSVPRQLLVRLAQGEFELLLSSAITAELRRALSYPKVRRYLRIPPAEVDLWVLALEVVSIPVEPTTIPSIVTADPDDNIYIAVALEGRADHIVTGDSHLLDVGEYEGIRLVRPRVFLDTLT